MIWGMEKMIILHFVLYLLIELKSVDYDTDRKRDVTRVTCDRFPDGRDISLAPY